MSAAPVEGTSLWYEEVGSGPRCLVMHGGLGIDHQAYRGLDGLAGVLRLVYYDHRCHGRSGDAPLETMALDRLADDADELRAHLGEERIGVLGHSFGGFIAYEFAARHPDHVAFLIIVCSSPSFDFGEKIAANMEAKMSDAMRDVLALPPPESPEERRDRAKTLLPLYFRRWDERYLDSLRDPVRPNYEAAVAAGRSLAGWSRWGALPQMRFPALLVMGRHDFIPHLDHAPRAVDLLPHGTLLVMEDSGHYPWLEEPHQFTSAVSDWLRRRVHRSSRSVP